MRDQPSLIGPPLPDSIHVIDSHTAGEPTRVVLTGGPDLRSGAMADRRALFAEKYDHFRRAVLLEPRGGDALVGALICDVDAAEGALGVIFFNNVGYLGMCGHGLIGLVVTLGYMGRLVAGKHVIATPVGPVHVSFAGGNRVSFDSVASYRAADNVAVAAPDIGVVRGSVAWGGNWFFIIDDHDQSLDLSRVADLTRYATQVRQALKSAGITGTDGAEIDHIELCGPPRDPANHGRNFVLCPGGAWDRSPCGTGTSAKLACLVAEGKLKLGECWRQEGMAGGVFESVALPPVASSPPPIGGAQSWITPRITGTAFVTAESTLRFHSDDPFRTGLGG